MGIVMQRSVRRLLCALAFTAPLAYASAAHAGIEACGDIHVEANAECELRGGIECEAECTPVRLEAQCAANLEIGCRGQCNASAEVSCTTDCSGACLAECEVDPGAFDCQASCFADCRGSCEASCADSECEASCEATCSGECDARCNVDLPEADCQAQCEACCSGSCTAEANIMCQIDCQAEGYAQCKADLEGGCKADCQTEKGALFCDGQYVDHGGNLEECVGALKALLDIDVSGYAEGECSNGSCYGEAGGSITCAVDPVGPTRWAAVLGVLGLVAFGSARRRTR